MFPLGGHITSSNSFPRSTTIVSGIPFVAFWGNGIAVLPSMPVLNNDISVEPDTLAVTFGMGSSLPPELPKSLQTPWTISILSWLEDAKAEPQLCKKKTPKMMSAGHVERTEPPVSVNRSLDRGAFDQ
jgi:hypothetical protein